MTHRWCGVLGAVWAASLGCAPVEGEGAPSEATQRSSQAVIDLYNPLSTTTRWAATPGVSASTGLAAVGALNDVIAFHRGDGSDGRLFYTALGSYGGSQPVPFSPTDVSTDPLAAASDPATERAFVALRNTAGQAMLFEATPYLRSLGGSPTWTAVGFTDGAPAVAVACGQVHVAVRNAEWLWTRSRPVLGGPWSPWERVAQAPGLPSLAAGPWSLALAVRGFDGYAHAWVRECNGAAAGTWTRGASLGDRPTTSDRIGLTAYGPFFAASIRGTDGLPYMMLQTFGTFGVATWPSSWERVGGSGRAPQVPVIETPVLHTHRGLLFAAARDSLGAVYYWVRNPNYLAPRAGRAMWVGGRVLTGGGLVATAPVFVTAQRYPVLGGGAIVEQARAPSELYVFARGIADRRVYFTNAGRFVTLDVLEGAYGMEVNTGPYANGIPRAAVPNLLENLQAFLRTPTRYWDSLGNTRSPGAFPGTCSSPGRTGITIFPNAGGGESAFSGDCPTRPTSMVVEDSGAAWRLWEETGHLAFWLNPFRDAAPFTSAFCGDPMNECPTTLRRCTMGAAPSGCPSGEACVRAWNQADDQPQGTCMVSTGFGGVRPRGYTQSYQSNGGDHDWLYTVINYRWFGEDLRRIAAQDLAAGDPSLQRKYDYVRVNDYDGVEFNGFWGSAVGAPTSDESYGDFALPLQ